MSTRMTWAHEMAGRAKAVGWKVTASRSAAGAYKVWMTPCGDERCNHLMQIHFTASDVNAHKTVLREMNAHGLEGLEIKLAALREEQRQQKIDKDRRAMERKAQLTTKTGLAIARAAGPYMTQAEDIDVSWFVTPHPAPWMRWANVTPEIAAKVLKDNNGDNRQLNKKTVSWYRDIILAGLWHLTHQGIAFDNRGMLQDGQHRFYAVLAAAEADPDFTGVPFAVFVGMPPENFKAIDEGMLRNARQLFGKAGEKNNGTLQACVRLAHYYLDDDVRRATRLRLPNQTVVNEFEADAENFRTATNYAQSKYMKIWCTPGPLAAAYYVIHKANGGADNEYCQAFFEGLITGLKPGTREVLDDDDPRSALRNRFQDAKLRQIRRSALTQMGMIILTWNNCVSGRFIRTLYFNDDTPIPKVLRCVPGEGVRPAAFQGVMADAA